MITTVKIVVAHAAALYWKSRVEKAQHHMRRNLQILAQCGSGKHETEHGFFVVSENNSYPAEKIQAQLSTRQIAQCMVKKWSNEQAKVRFPVAYQNAKTNNGYKVSI